MKINPPILKLIEAMNDQPIAFNKHYVFLGCGINGALMLSQLVYWTSRTRDKDGWIYKDHHDWTQETGLTRKEQHTARKVLKELNFISEKKHGVPPRVYFRVEREKLYEALIKYSESLADSQLCHTEQLNVPNGTIECAERNKQMCATAQTNVPKGSRNTESTAESTAETLNISKEKPKKSRAENLNEFDAKTVELPTHVDRDLWIQFVDMRNAKRKPLTENAVSLLIKKMESFGAGANESLENSIIGGYQGLFAPKQPHSAPVNQNNQEPGYFNQVFNQYQESDVIDVTSDYAVAGGLTHV